MSELLDVFSNIKKTVYKHNSQKYDMETVFSKMSGTMTKSDIDYIQGAYLYVYGMKSSLEAIGTKIIEIYRYTESVVSGDQKGIIAGQNGFENALKELFVLIDSFVDSITAFSKVYQAKGQEYDFIRTIMELRAKRDLLMKNGNAYMTKLIKTQTDNQELQFFLSDFLDTLLNEAYRLQINRLMKTFDAVLNKKGTIEELW